jgi:hypothetical protein
LLQRKSPLGGQAVVRAVDAAEEPQPISLDQSRDTSGRDLGLGWEPELQPRRLFTDLIAQERPDPRLGAELLGDGHGFAVPLQGVEQHLSARRTVGQKLAFGVGQVGQQQRKVHRPALSQAGVHELVDPLGLDQLRAQ